MHLAQYLHLYKFSRWAIFLRWPPAFPPPSLEVVGVCPSLCLFLCFFLFEQRNLLTYWGIFVEVSNIIYICLRKSWLHFGDVNVTVAYFKIALKFMGPLPRRRSELYECNSLVISVLPVLLLIQAQLNLTFKGSKWFHDGHNHSKMPYMSQLEHRLRCTWLWYAS